MGCAEPAGLETFSTDSCLHVGWAEPAGLETFSTGSCYEPVLKVGPFFFYFRGLETFSTGSCYEPVLKVGPFFFSIFDFFLKK